MTEKKHFGFPKTVIKITTFCLFAEHFNNLKDLVH